MLNPGSSMDPSISMVVSSTRISARCCCWATAPRCLFQLAPAPCLAWSLLSWPLSLAAAGCCLATLCLLPSAGLLFTEGRQEAEAKVQPDFRHQHREIGDAPPARPGFASCCCLACLCSAGHLAFEWMRLFPPGWNLLPARLRCPGISPSRILRGGDSLGRGLSSPSQS